MTKSLNPRQDKALKFCHFFLVTKFKFIVLKEEKKRCIVNNVKRKDKRKELKMKEKLQKFGRALSAMVMPNIAVFIAWGLITSFFIADGWLPNAHLAALVDPMNKFLLPILIGYTGGKNVYGQRGATVGSIMTIGVLVGVDIPMYIGAMIAGPFGAYLIKRLDQLLENRIPQGFEMLVNNFSAGILGFFLAIVGCYAINPICLMLNDVIKTGVYVLVEHGLLPLLSIIVEPAKVLFLNNAINHGIFSPIGSQEVMEAGKSIFYLIESNPGPGLGVLLAYCFFGKGASKGSAPGAAIIHFFGGIHEIYFPYILMNPLLLLAAIAGGMTGILVNVIFNSGLVSAASPGSIIAILGMCHPSSYIGVILSVVLATIVSMAVASIILKTSKIGEDDLEKAQDKMQAMKVNNKNANNQAIDFTKLRKIVFACDAGMGSSAMGATILTKKLKSAGIEVDVPHYVVIFPITNFMGGQEYDEIVAKLSGSHEETEVVKSEEKKLRKIVFACDAGMGSSAMGATILTKKLKSAGIEVDVPHYHYAINDIPSDVEVVVTHESLANRVRSILPNVVVFPITNFMGGQEYDDIVEKLK